MQSGITYPWRQTEVEYLKKFLVRDGLADAAGILGRSEAEVLTAAHLLFSHSTICKRTIQKRNSKLKDVKEVLNLLRLREIA